jgi:hypothetical protein
VGDPVGLGRGGADLNRRGRARGRRTSSSVNSGRCRWPLTPCTRLSSPGDRVSI